MKRNPLATPFTYFFQARFLLFISLLILTTSCFEQPTNQRNEQETQGGQSSSTDHHDVPPPSFGNDLNFFQNGNVQSSSSLSVSKNLEDIFYLRGAEVDQYIRNIEADGNVLCLISHFPSSQENQVLVSTMSPQSFYNFSKGEREHFYVINAIDSEKAQSFCKTSGIEFYIDDQFASADIAWSIPTLCPSSNCHFQVYQSANVEVFSPSGNPISFINTSYLSLRILNQSSSSSSDDVFCQESSTCYALGLDCCIDGQCVRDLQPRPEADNDPDYQIALDEILENPSKIYDYPQYFFICQAPPSPAPPSNDYDSNSEEEALARMVEKKELFMCTTPLHAEMGICTKRYQNVSQDGTTTYATGNDDRNFLTTYTGSVPLQDHSLYQVIYAGETLFENGQTILSQGFSFSGGNDSLDDATTIELTRTPASSAPNDDLIIRYQIDASCERINSQLARCSKYYVQGQDKGLVDDHFPGTQTFKLPFYASLSQPLQVIVDEQITFQGQDWQLQATSPPQIVFVNPEMQILDTQKVQINYFVNTLNHNILAAKEEALTRINQMCDCQGGIQCRLKEQRNSDGEVTNYVCDYPAPPAPIPPFQQTVFLSAKSTPHRYFDVNGMYHAAPDANTAPQELPRFEYRNGNLLRPNNTDFDEYIGFSEIYGSYNISNAGAKPAREVHVMAGKTYDIYVDSGSFSSCQNCGNDYYTSLARLFPNNFTQPGGGLSPHPHRASKLNPGEIRADDFIFGRACFVPATMLAWTHPSSGFSAQEQRLRRLASQHFLFANGMQRDWYGFDYGSVIGSFDGVTWFSVGTQRRIRATSNRLFLAINAYFGDLTTDASYRIQVMEISGSNASASIALNDHQSDGAQCRRYHECQTDRDCVTRLGWDYSCENVSNLRTHWPRFNIQAQEIGGQSAERRLFDIFNITAGSAKRCVYRGAGAPCTRSYTAATQQNSYSRTNAFSGNSPQNIGHHLCSMNNYCQEIVSGVAQEKFNNRISRYARAVRTRNSSSQVDDFDLNEFGLASPHIGRPYHYRGHEAIHPESYAGLISNNVTAICRPGRDPSTIDNFSQSHAQDPSNQAYHGDKINAIGMTMQSLTIDNENYLASCPAFDISGNFSHKNISSANGNIADLSKQRTLASGQNLSSNALRVFETEAIASQQITADFENDHITRIKYQLNRCLRAPGSTCHTDMDCAPNSIIRSRIGNQQWGPHLQDILNPAEFSFWQEELICSQRALPHHDDFDLSNNRCCRDIGRSVRLSTHIPDPVGHLSIDREVHPDIAPHSIPGVDIPLNDPSRYSRNATYKLAKEQAPQIQLKQLEVAARGSCDNNCEQISGLHYQWRTIHEMNKRTCCSENWVREFSNTNDKRWGPSRMQRFNKSGLRCLNWRPIPSHCDDDNCSPFRCNISGELPETSSTCAAIDITEPYARRVFEYLQLFELTGIPQIAIGHTHNSIQCKVDHEQRAPDSPFTIPFVLDEDAADNELLKTSIDNSDREYESSSNGPKYTNAHIYNDAYDIADGVFNENLRQVFSPDQFRCCRRTGDRVGAGEEDQCCSGFTVRDSEDPTIFYCAHQDFVNLSVYFNRYVSSEAQALNDSLFDENGFAKNPETIEQLACARRACASDTLARGVSWSHRRVLGFHTEDNPLGVHRFIDGNDTATNNYDGLANVFDEGVRWNIHVYCVPATYRDNDIEDAAEDEDLDANLMRITRCQPRQ